jgi:L-ribulose-5-phosphate 4-epimerase
MDKTQEQKIKDEYIADAALEAKIREDKVKAYKVKDIYMEEAARGTRMLYERGFSPDGDNGDVSVKDPETGYVYISASPVPVDYRNLGEYRASDMCVVDLDGNRITTWSRPTIEMPMHIAILKARPDANAVVHTHGDWSSVFSISGKNIPLTLAEHYAHLGPGEVVCADYGKAGSFELAEVIVKAMGKNNAALMRNHGAVVVGRTLDEAFTNAQFLESIAQKTLFALLLGGLTPMKPEDVLDDWMYS